MMISSFFSAVMTIFGKKIRLLWPLPTWENEAKGKYRRTKLFFFLFFSFYRRPPAVLGEDHGGGERLEWIRRRRRCTVQQQEEKKKREVLNLVTEPCPESKKMMVSLLLLLQGPRDVNSKLPGDTVGRSFEICPPFYVGCAHMYRTSFFKYQTFEKSYMYKVWHTDPLPCHRSIK